MKKTSPGLEGEDRPLERPIIMPEAKKSLPLYTGVPQARKDPREYDERRKLGIAAQRQEADDFLFPLLFYYAEEQYRMEIPDKVFELLDNEGQHAACSELLRLIYNLDDCEDAHLEVES